MKKGWIKLHRKMVDNPTVYRDSVSIAVWVHLLLSASHDDYKTKFNGKEIVLKPGELITSTIQIAEELVTNQVTIRRVLDRFQSDQLIDQQTTRHGRLISIKNWKKYQICDQPNDQQMTNQDEKSDQPSDQYTRSIKKNNKQEDDYVGVVSRWNALPDPVPKITRIVHGSTRDKLTKKRIADYGVGEILRAIDNVGRSTFLCGGGSKGWTITFDWFIRPENFQKVLDGNYTDHQAQTSTAIYTGEITDEMRELYGNKSWG